MYYDRWDTIKHDGITCYKNTGYTLELEHERYLKNNLISGKKERGINSEWLKELENCIKKLEQIN